MRTLRIDWGGRRREATHAHIGAWEVTTRGDGRQVETRYRLLRWDHLCRNDLAPPPWWKMVQVYHTTGIALLNGAFGRM